MLAEAHERTAAVTDPVLLFSRKSAIHLGKAIRAEAPLEGKPGGKCRFHTIGDEATAPSFKNAFVMIAIDEGDSRKEHRLSILLALHALEEVGDPCIIGCRGASTPPSRVNAEFSRKSVDADASIFRDGRKAMGGSVKRTGFEEGILCIRRSSFLWVEL